MSRARGAVTSVESATTSPFRQRPEPVAIETKVPTWQRFWLSQWGA